MLAGSIRYSLKLIKEVNFEGSLYERKLLPDSKSFFLHKVPSADRLAAIKEKLKTRSEW